MRISLGALVPALVLSSLVGVLVELWNNINLIILSQNEILFWSNLIFIVEFIINPILVFVTFFLIGRRIEIVKDLIPVTFSLFLGVLIGFWIGFIPEIYFMTHYYGGLEQTSALIQLNIYTYDISRFPLLFFTSFSAICAASIVKVNILAKRK